ncbi:hypothetical protein C8J56DRAFT_955638 [Mycena floridula]|nr:hypothetical protein C8J56DRAFT_955638 [Mycena floridula]
MSHRHISSPELVLSPRAELPQGIWPSIDSVLKDLKLCSRNIQTVFVAYSEELRILERLYYKGKNQHRSAIFWRRVAEVRRYGKRLQPVAVSQILDALQTSFFGSESSRKNSKSFKGPWTHYPNAQLLAFVIERLSAYLALADKMHRQLQEAYRTFNLAMQSGSFLQLILTMVAIVSRADILVLQLVDIIGQGLLIAQRAQNLICPESRPVIHGDSTLVMAVVDAAIKDADLILDDDMGAVIQITEQLPVSPQRDTDMVIFPAKEEPRIIPTVIRKASPKPQVIKKKKKKKRDEIDDIFGF